MNQLPTRTWLLLKMIVWMCLALLSAEALTIRDVSVQFKPKVSAEFASLFNSEKQTKESKVQGDSEFSSLFQADNRIHKLSLVSDAPTSRPTLSPVNDENILSFKAVVELQQVDRESFTQESFDTVRETLETLWNAKSEQFGPGEVISFARKLLDEESTEESRRRLSNAPYNTTFVIGFPVWFALKDYPTMQGNGTKLFTYLTTLMTNKVISGEFAQLLISIAQTNNAEQLYQVIVPIIQYYDFYVFAQSKTPTMYPSSMPTSAPSSGPTSAPSSAPSTGKTPAPTFAPTELPSGIPSSRPSLAPTKNYANTFLQFSVFFGVNNVTSQTLSLGGEQSLLETITDITDVPADDMVYKGITNEIPGGNVPGRRQLSSSWDMVIEVQLTIPLDDYPQFRGHPDEIFDFLKALFLSSVYDQSSPTDLPLFTEHLRKNSLLWGKEMFWAEVVKVDFSNWILIKDYKKSTPEPTSQPTGRPTSSPTISDTPDSLVFNAYWGFDQTTTTTLSLAGQTSLLETMIDVMDVSLNNVEYVAVTDAVRRRKLTEAHQMVVQTKVIISLADYPELQGNATKIYLYLTNVLTTSVFEADHPFQQILRSKATKSGATEIENVVVFEVKFDPFYLQRHTKSPTVAPTLAPNSDPSTSPTFAPTSNNNNGGNNDNSDAPTLHPTEAPNGGGGGGGGGDGSTPTFVPSYAPTFSPTIAPTSTNGGGGENTPTRAPTTQTQPIIQYKAIFWIQNLTSTSFQTLDQNILLKTIAEVNEIPVNNIEYLGIRAVLHNRRQLSTTAELVIATRITYNMIDYLEYNANATKLYVDTTGNLRTSVDGDDFTTAFTQNGNQMNSNNINSLTDVIRVEFEDFSIISPVINSNEMGQIKIDSTQLAAIISSVIVGFGLLLFLIYVGYVRCYDREEKDTMKGGSSAESQEQDGSVMDSIDFETIYDENAEWNTEDMIIINIMEDERSAGSARSGFGNVYALPSQVVTYEHNTTESRL